MFVIFEIALGLVVGFLLNFFWFLFHAALLGWRDSGPDWYITIQADIKYLIFAVSIIGSIVVLQRWHPEKKKRKKRK